MQHGLPMYVRGAMTELYIAYLHPIVDRKVLLHECDLNYGYVVRDMTDTNFDIMCTISKTKSKGVIRSRKIEGQTTQWQHRQIIKVRQLCTV